MVRVCLNTSMIMLGHFRFFLPSMAKYFRNNFINPHIYSRGIAKLVFCWDFTVTHEKAVKLKQKNLSTEIRVRPRPQSPPPPAFSQCLCSYSFFPSFFPPPPFPSLSHFPFSVLLWFMVVHLPSWGGRGWRAVCLDRLGYMVSFVSFTSKDKREGR